MPVGGNEVCGDAHQKTDDYPLVSFEIRDRIRLIARLVYKVRPRNRALFIPPLFAGCGVG